jgi:fibronectin-binding autotransporter adhesin
MKNPTAARRPRFSLLRRMLFSLAACALLACATPLLARNWTGAASANWSDPNNWSPIGVPTNGDSVAFGLVSDSHHSMINDLANLQLKDVEFANNDYQLDGDALEILGYVLNGNDPSTITTSHTTTINCPLIFSGHGDIFGYDGTRIVQNALSGDITETTIYMHLNGPITLNGNLDVFVYASQFRAGGNAHLYLSGPISGTGNIYAYTEEAGGHASSLEFNGTPGNTFSGTLNLYTVGSSQVIFNKSSGVVVNDGIGMKAAEGYDATNAILNIAAPNQIGTNATIVLNGGSQLHLTGQNATVGELVLTNFSGNTIASALDTGTTTVSLNGGITTWNDSASVIPLVKGKLALNDLNVGWLTFNIGGSQSAGLDLQSPIGGFGGFTKVGLASVLLESSNSFTGPVFVNQGILDLRNNYALGYPTTSTFLRGGSLTLRNVTIPESLSSEAPNSLLFSIGTCTWSGPISLSKDLLVWADNTTLSGQITGSGGITFINDTATIAGTANNTYTGTTVAHGNLLQLNKPSGTNAFAGPLIVGSPGNGSLEEVRWLQSYQHVYTPVTIYSTGYLNLTNHNEDFASIDFYGGEMDSGPTGQIGVYGNITDHGVTVFPTSSQNGTILGQLGLPSGTWNINTLQPYPGTLDILATVFGAGGFQKIGPGYLRLFNNNSYSGLTIVSTGEVELDNPSALGSTGTGTIVQDGGTVVLNTSGTIGELMSLRGAGADGISGALEVLGTVTLQNQFPSIYAALDLITDATVRVASPGSLTTSGFISGTGPLRKVGTGAMHLAGSGNNTFTGDTIVTGGTLYLDKSSAYAVPQNLVIGPASALSPAAVRWNNNSEMGGTTATVNANSLLDLNGNVQTLSQLNLNDGGNAQSGSGLFGFNSGGVVQVGSLNLLGSHAGSTISGLIELPENNNLTFTVAPYAFDMPLNPPPELTVSANLQSDFDNPNFVPAGIVKNGFGQMTLGGNNTFAGSANIYAGTLIPTSATALGTTKGATYTWNSGELVLTGGITISGESLYFNGTNNPALDSRAGVNTWAGIIGVSGNSFINVNNTLNAAGVISGSGSLTKTGVGTLAFTGSAANTYSGDTFVNLGTLALQRPAGTTAIPHNVTIGNGSGAATLSEQSGFSIVGQVTVNAGGLWDLTGQAEGFSLTSPAPLTLNDGGSVQTGNSGIVYLPVGGDVVVNPGTNTSTITGNIGLDAGIHHFNVAAGPNPGLLVNATISQTGAAAAIQKDGAGSLRLIGTNIYTGTNIVAAGNLQVDGPQPASSVQVSGGTLLGNGTVGNLFYAGSGIVSPGASPGILTTSNFNASAGAGTLRMELNGPAAGSQYDQLNVRGSVNLNGVTLSVIPGYIPATNQQFTLISNDGADTVTGTFAGLPQNGQLHVANSVFQINYSGGTGNDVVLTHLYTLPAPTLSILSDATQSVRVFWSTNYPDYRLETNLDLATTNWSAWPLPPALVGTNYTVTNSTTASPLFYRLAWP